jgi:hypothetical protein
MTIKVVSDLIVVPNAFVEPEAGGGFIDRDILSITVASGGGGTTTIKYTQLEHAYVRGGFRGIRLGAR